MFGKKRRKYSKIARYDLDRVYSMGQYTETVNYGRQNIGIKGVKEQLQELEQKKVDYFRQVAQIVNPNREQEQIKYQKYEMWERLARIIKLLEIVLLLIVVVNMFLSGMFRFSGGFWDSSGWSRIVSFLEMLLIFVGLPLCVISILCRTIYGKLYVQYAESIRERVDELGSGFKKNLPHITKASTGCTWVRLIRNTGT